jgi:TRAP transporter 4TM/12TM fusion protein
MTEVAPAESAGRGWMGRVIVAIGVAMALYHLYAIAISPPSAFQYRIGHLLFAIGLTFLAYPLARGRGWTWWDAPFLLAAVAGVAYPLVVGDYIENRTLWVDDPNAYDLVFGTVTILMVLEGTRRIIGLALPLTAVAFLAWALTLGGIEYARVVEQLILGTEGIYGSTLGVSAAYVLIFVLFGAFMERAGTGQLFMDFALALTGTSAGGPGKVSVVSSSLFGTISGSAVANVMVDGPITIPLMKRSGFKAHFAAGVEAVASTGGQIMPPIMGAAAFVMAEFLNVSYWQVVVWAIVPSLLYYIACFGSVHFYAKRAGLMGLPRAECPVLATVLAERGHLFLPLGVILLGMFTGFSPPLSALFATASCVPLILLPRRHLAYVFGLAIVVAAAAIGQGTGAKQWTNGLLFGCAVLIAASIALAAWRRTDRPALARNLGHCVGALADGAKNALSVAMACACAGIVIGIIAKTGLGIIFTQKLLGIAENALWIALVVTAVAGIVLGMGMPTTPAYILMTSLLVPAIVKLGQPLGVPLPAAHMFAFYFAILSAITPPVALAVFAAASLAKADLWKSGWAAMRIGAAGFIVPFMFVYEPSLLLIGAWHDALLSGATAAIGCLALAAGLEGYFVRRSTWWERAVMVAAALLLIKPGLVTDAIGLGLLAAMWAWQKFAAPGPAAERAP